MALLPLLLRTSRRLSTLLILLPLTHPLTERLHAISELARFLQRLGVGIRFRFADGGSGLADLLLQIVEIVLDVAIEGCHVRCLASTAQDLIRVPNLVANAFVADPVCGFGQLA